MIYLELFWTFFKIGLFTIGGGQAMIPMISQEVVQKVGLQSSKCNLSSPYPRVRPVLLP